MKRNVRGAKVLVACSAVAAACIGATSCTGGGNAAFDESGNDSGSPPGADSGKSGLDSSLEDTASPVQSGDTGAASDTSTPVESDSGADVVTPDPVDAADGEVVEGDAGIDASEAGTGAVDSGVDAEAVDSGIDSGTAADTGVDAESANDAAADASDAASGDASSTTAFGTTCPPGAVYSDAFTTNPLTAGIWTTIVGTVTYDGTNDLLALATGTPNTQAWIGARPAWTDYTVSVAIRIDTTGSTENGGINFRMTNPGTGNDSGQMYYASLLPTGVQLGKESNGWMQLALVAATFNTGTFYTLTVTANGSALSVAVDGTTYITFTDSSFTTGSVGLRTYLSGMSYEHFSVTCNP